MDSVGKHLFIYGRVQGVGYRNFTQTRARRLGVAGWVRNLPDGRVEAVVHGPESRVHQLLGELEKGPSIARVDRIEEAGRIIEPQPEPFEVR